MCHKSSQANNNNNNNTHYYIYSACDTIYYTIVDFD